jgi:hypothetical protein
MPRKTLLIVILIAFLIGVVTFAVYFLYIAPRPEGEEALNVFDFFPFGDRNPPPVIDTAPTATTTIPAATSTRPVVLPVLRRLSTEPQAGAVATTTSGELFVRYIARRTGHAYEAAATSTVNRRISNTTIPKVYEALWTKQADRVVLRYLKDATDETVTFFGTLVAKGDGEIEGTFLPSNIPELVMSPDGTRLFYLLSDADGASGTILSFKDMKQTRAFSSPLSEWLVSWPATSTVALSSKPSAAIGGRGELLDVKSGSAVSILRGVRGLAMLPSPDGKYVLYSETVERKPALKLFRLKDGAVFDLSLESFPEKCTWSARKPVIYCAAGSLPLGEYPDSWYQGTVTFTDDLWKISAETGETELLYPLSQAAGFSFDAIKLFLTPAEDYLVFTNKNDSMLWSLDLARAAEADIGAGEGD